jgi:hypothetical protein
MPILDPVEKPIIVTGIVRPIIVDIPNPNAPLLGRKVAVGGALLLDLPELLATFREGLESKLLSFLLILGCFCIELFDLL